MSKPFKRHSQLQKDVLSLYRAFLKAIREKSAVRQCVCALLLFNQKTNEPPLAHTHQLSHSTIQDQQPSFHAAVREGFERNRSAVSPREVARIEFMVRQGKKQLKYIQSPTCQSIGTTTVGSSGS